MIFGKPLRAWLPVALAVVLVPLALSLLARQIYQAGHTAGASGVQARWDQQRAAQALQLATDLLTQKQRADALQGQLDALEANRQKEKAHAQTQNDTLRQRVRTGAVRLSVPAVDHGAPQLASGSLPTPPVAAGGPAPTRAELDPAAAADLVAIAQDGDNAIRDLNACIDRYHTVTQPGGAVSASESLTPDVQAR